ncbi:MAG: hypothetical protein WC977_01395 [Anaerovoracaceae bacterium]
MNLRLQIGDWRFAGGHFPSSVFRVPSVFALLCLAAATAEDLRVERVETLTLPTVESQSQRPRPSRRVNWAERNAERALRYYDAVADVHPDWTTGTTEYDAEWLGAWREYSEIPLGHVPCADLATLRAVGEVRTPHTPAESANQLAELAYFRTLGYNGILAVWHGEDSRALAGILDSLHADGWRIVLAYGQPEGRGKTRPYRRLDTFRARLAPLLTHAEAFAPAWRGTSIPHTRRPAKLAEYHRQVSAIARELRSDLPILGESFLRRGTIETAVPDYAGGIVVFNAGYSQIRPEAVVGMLPDGTPALTLVIGPKPYYASYHEIPDWKKGGVHRTRERIADRYRTAGTGTITLAGDGADNRAPTPKTNPTHDTLTRSQWRPEQ